MSTHNKEHISETWAGLGCGFLAIGYAALLYETYFCHDKKKQKNPDQDLGEDEYSQCGKENNLLSIEGNSASPSSSSTAVNDRVSILGGDELEQKEEDNLDITSQQQYGSMNSYKKMQGALQTPGNGKPPCPTLSNSNGKLAFFNPNKKQPRLSKTRQPTDSSTTVDVKVHSHVENDEIMQAPLLNHQL